MKIRKIILIKTKQHYFYAIIVNILILYFTSFSVVDGYTGIIVNYVLSKGYHFKIPIIATTVQIDNRVAITEVK